MDAVRKPLEAPYAGPHEVTQRIDDRLFVIRINGEDKTVSVDSLKPAYVAKLDAEFNQDGPDEPTCPPLSEPALSSTMDRPLRTYAKKKVSFPCNDGKVSEEGVTVALPSTSTSSAPRASLDTGANLHRQRKQTLTMRAWN